MTAITNSSQLVTFVTIRDIIITNSVIAAKFRKEQFHRFEPKHKSQSFTGYPYMIISIPITEDVDSPLGDLVANREFTIDIIMRMEYEAKDNMETYASQVVKELDNSTSTFLDAGYYPEKITFDGSDTVTIDQKELVECKFTLILSGEVS